MDSSTEPSAMAALFSVGRCFVRRPVRADTPSNAQAPAQLDIPDLAPNNGYEQLTEELDIQF